MIDIQLIDELRALPIKEGKEKLAEYAANFNITVKKTRSFDNMVEDIKAAFAELADEPMPDQNEGLSINDLIAAADQGDNVELLVDQPVVDAVEVLDVAVEDKLIQDYKILNVVESEDSPQVELAVEIKPVKAIEHIVLTATIEKEVVKDESDSIILPKSYSPSLQMIGSGHMAYVTLPWWIYEWVSKNPDWKSKPHSFPHYHGIDSLLSLIYYINRNGQVRIRETRNSSFVILK